MKTSISTMLAASLLVSAVLVSPTSAARKTPNINGWAQCYTWCENHNKQQVNKKKCEAQCDKYWLTPRANGTYNELTTNPANPASGTVGLNAPKPGGTLQR